MRGALPALAAALSLLLAACTAEPSRQPAKAPAASRTQSPLGDGTTIRPGDLAGYLDSAEHDTALVPVANVPRRPPMDVEEAVGSDLAFTGGYAIAGNYLGFTVYDISRPEQPQVVSQVYCPGPQNDVTVSGNLLFLSVDLGMGGERCDAPGTGDWEGLRIFDIADKRAPRYVGAVRTPCGSHTATLIPSDDPASVYLFATSAPSRTSGSACHAAKGSITVVKVPVADPARATVAAQPELLEDGGSPAGTDHILVGGCHDVTVYAPKRLAAASCIGDGLLLDVSDPLRPKVLDRVRDPKHFGYWHSAVFSQDGSKVVFSDEFGGGRSSVCPPARGGTWGANGVYTLKGTKLTLQGYFMIPRVARGTCSAHNGSLVPVPGRDVMVQGWYEGGVSVIDFTDPAHAREIGYFQRGHAPVSMGGSGGSWSAYYYNGYIYSSDLYSGLDVLKLTGVRQEGQRLTEFNAQTQG
ncbi:hypothetical protein [Nonomuraea sp. NPDC050310]|uniref:LVIVD repeat-containing protein n=1 Tax=Nonomuraea sp. NPDC050310 TaxID=3154935 RepID=UPI0033C01EC2